MTILFFMGLTAILSIFTALAMGVIGAYSKGLPQNASGKITQWSLWLVAITFFLSTTIGAFLFPHDAFIYFMRMGTDYEGWRQIWFPFRILLRGVALVGFIYFQVLVSLCIGFLFSLAVRLILITFSAISDGFKQLK